MKQFIQTYLYCLVLSITVGLIQPSVLKGMIVVIPTIITVVFTKKNRD